MQRDAGGDRSRRGRRTMRRDAVRQLRTVAGHQAAATPQEEAAGISGGQEAKARRATDAPREGVVLLHAVVRYDRRWLGFRTPVPRSALRGPGRVHTARRFRAGTGAMHHGAPRTVGRPVQLHVELVPGGVHQRRVQLQSHLREVQDGGWRRRWRRRGRRKRHRWKWCHRWWCRRARSHSQRCRAAGQHQGLRIPAGCGLFQLHEVVRRAGRHVPVPLFPAKPHAGRGGLRQTAAVRRHRPLLCCAVHRLRCHVHRAVRHALRLSDDRATTGTVQELSRTLAHRRIQVRVVVAHSTRDILSRVFLIVILAPRCVRLRHIDRGPGGSAVDNDHA